MEGMFAEEKPVSRWERKIKEELFRGCCFSITRMVIKQQFEKAETLQKVKSSDDLCKYIEIPGDIKVVVVRIKIKY